MIINTEKLIQSPFLYAQAAGSDFSDFSSRGVHLRWQLKGLLGDLHLPKGNLTEKGSPYETTIGYNCANDFVNLYKANYKREYSVDVQLLKPPTSVVETGNVRKWLFENLPVAGLTNSTTNVEVRFMDKGMYDVVRSQFSPFESPSNFMQAYTGVLEVQAIGQLMFKTCFLTDTRQSQAELKLESITVPDLHHTEEAYISCREKINLNNLANTNDNEWACITCENMEYVRFQTINSFVKIIRLVTYNNTALGYQKDWVLVDKFSLSENDSEVIKRIDNPINSENKVNGQWPKYNDVKPATGAFTVSVNNYIDRWKPALAGSNGIKYALQKYLALSRTDLLAQDNAPSGNEGDAAVNEFSYLQIMNILATDYHVARMFGLGHIDQQTREEQENCTIYCTTYQTTAALGPDFPAKLRLHISITLPTKQTDYRYPPAPKLKPVSYGLDSLNGGSSASQITLPGGYTPDGLARFVKINQEPFPHQKALESFFATPKLFCLCTNTLPILYGLEYRSNTEVEYRQPEILHDSFYFDHSGLPETLPIPDQNEPDKAIFTHRETEEGIHHYALYSINWFSRVSPLSNDVVTDTTVFNRKPLPPINLMTQFIQEEKQLIFSTSIEQAMLSSIAGADKSLARVTFEWNQVHNDAYQFADEIEIFIRKQLALMIKGKVTNVQNLPNNKALVSTGTYTISSVNPPQVTQPNIPAALASSFIGGIFASEQFLFEIDSISSTGNNPSFVVKKILQRTSIEDPSEPGSYLMSETYKSPTINDLFAANQNLSQPAQWDASLDKKVKLEKFFPINLSASSDAANNKSYTIQKLLKFGGNTEITVKENIPSPGAVTPGKISYTKFVKYFETIHIQKAILINDNLTSEITAGTSIKLQSAGGNTGNYTIAAVFFGNHFTRVEFVQALPDTGARAGVMVLEKTKTITSFNAASRKFIIAGQDLSKELIPAHREFHLIDEGENVHEFVIGGIVDTAKVVSILDPVTGQASGAVEIRLNNFVLQAPLDTDTNWYKGSVRIEEDPANFPPVGSINYRSPEIKVLQVWNIDISGAHTKIIAFDTTFQLGSPMSNPKVDYMPIRMGNTVPINLHPGYRTYLTHTNANASGTNPFRALDLLPISGEGQRRNLLAARSKDTVANKNSAISPPVVLLAQEIITPEPPGVPVGPSFATRPDVYGKSTYTFDTDVNTAGGRQPYAIVFYRANLRRILSILYLPATVETILTEISALPTDDAAFFNNRFHDLANVDFDTVSNQFRAYISGGYRFPIPNNSNYVIPNPNTSIIQKPFNGSRTFGQNFLVTLHLNGSGTPVTESTPMQQIIKNAIDGAFLSMTEQPVLYRYIKDGRLTSPAKPKLRNSNGELILPGNPIDFNVFDPFPMAVKYLAGSQMKVRFTDYTLDGAADTFYFYFGAELNSKFEVSDRSPVSGPISLVNTIAAEAPAIKEIISTPADILRKKGPEVKFKINDFIDSEKIKRIRIYRATNHREAVSVRNMTLANEYAINEQLIDTFDGISDLPYAEPLFYRMVALREITNEQGLTEYVPSKPSEISLTNIIDVLNPEAPQVTFTSDVYTPADPQMNNIVLTWNKTVHNGKYLVFKLNSSGNWVKIHEITSNLASIVLPLASTTLGSGTIEKLSASNELIYHHLKVVAVNSSNLLSLEERVFTI